MFGSNTTIGSQNSYKEGYNEGVEDVLIAFSEMLDTIKDDNTYEILMQHYTKLSSQFIRSDESEEE